MTKGVVHWAYALIALVDRLVPGSGGTTLVSFPDIDDTVAALLKSPGRPAGRVHVLAESASDALGRAKCLGLTVKIVPRKSLRGLWVYWRSTVCLSTHGIWGTIRRGRHKFHASTWHGELGKSGGIIYGEPAKNFDRIYVSNSVSRVSKVAEMGVPATDVIVTGQPRLTLLASPARGSMPSARHHIVWAPTYRSSQVGSRKKDGDLSGFNRFIDDFLEVSEPLLERHDALLWLRFHPFATPQELDRPRVRIASNSALESFGITFYDLMGHADALVTDFSSLWLDYMILDRPMICAAPDWDEYLSGRPMILEPYKEWFPGSLVREPEELARTLERVFEGRDASVAKRSMLRALLCPNVPPLDSAPDVAVWRDLTGLAGGRDGGRDGDRDG